MSWKKKSGKRKHELSIHNQTRNNKRWKTIYHLIVIISRLVLRIEEWSYQRRRRGWNQQEEVSAALTSARRRFCRVNNQGKIPLCVVHHEQWHRNLWSLLGNEKKKTNDDDDDDEEDSSASPPAGVDHRRRLLVVLLSKYTPHTWHSCTCSASFSFKSNFGALNDIGALLLLILQTAQEIHCICK